ncbi:hypothetical protein WMF20_01690 [Sorangium sp. So ce834]|uniref:hypothetical protein n=1 Tax=Sorangium sp. So ce834 TaxID=3133321 RepID=UPI003F5DE34A
MSGKRWPGARLAPGGGAAGPALLGALVCALILPSCKGDGGGAPPAAAGPSLACGDRTVQRGNECVAEPDGTPPAVRCGPGTTLVAGECVAVQTSEDDDLIDAEVDLSGSGFLPACIDAPPDAVASNGSCVVVDGVMVTCNPITNEGCEGQVGQCGYDAFAGLFQCLWQTNDAKSCKTCSVSFETCGPGFTCMGGLYACQRYCCDDGDCGEGAACVLQPPLPFGICQAQRSDAFAHLSDFRPPDPGAGVGGWSGEGGWWGEGGWSGEGGFGEGGWLGEGGFGEGGWSGEGGAGGRAVGAGGAGGAAGDDTSP